MPKHKPHPPGRPKNTRAPSTTVFFYLPNDLPYGIFCQWHPSRIAIPHSSLHWLCSSSHTSTILSEYPTPLVFTCAEQFYMFSKALYFHDAHSARRILSCTDPKAQKDLGKAVKGFNDYKWTRVKSRVCRVGNWYKFRDDVGLRGVLLGTGEKELCEASPVDRVWGIGFGAEEADEYRGEWGQNLLGRALMDVRRRLVEKLRVQMEGGEMDWEWDGGEEDEGGDRSGVEAADTSSDLHGRTVCR